MNWRPSSLMKISGVIHGASLCSAIIDHTTVLSASAAILGNHAVLTACMFPKNQLLGPNIVRLPASSSSAVALTFDDGPDPNVTIPILDVLEEFNARSTFFLIGQRAQRYPFVVREIVRRGHAVANHTQTHPARFACFGPVQMRREIRLAQSAIYDACGVGPQLFRAPMGLRNPLLDPVLAREGLSLVSWTRRGYDGVSSHPERILARLTRGLAARDILLLHDTAGREHAGRAAVLTVLPQLLRRIAAAGLTTTTITAPRSDAHSGHSFRV